MSRRKRRYDERTAVTHVRRVPLKTVALPNEHGAWALLPALGLWLLVCMRSIPSVIYVRTRLALEYGRPVDRRPAPAAAALAVAVAVPFVVQGVFPLLALGALVMLLGRAAWGLSRLRRPRRNSTWRSYERSGKTKPLITPSARSA